MSSQLADDAGCGSRSGAGELAELVVAQMLPSITLDFLIVAVLVLWGWRGQSGR